MSIFQNVPGHGVVFTTCIPRGTRRVKTAGNSGATGAHPRAAVKTLEPRYGFTRFSLVAWIGFLFLKHARDVVDDTCTNALCICRGRLGARRNGRRQWRKRGVGRGSTSQIIGL